MSTPARGRLVVISGPSGSGKTSVIEHLRGHPRVTVSISVTTRPKRPHERDGRDYHFVDRARFLELKAQDRFVETNDVFGNGHLYGSLRSELEEALGRPGHVLIMEVDVVGAAHIRQAGYDGLHVFIAPPSQQVLEQRLRARGTDDEEAIRRRLARAAKERALAEEDGAVIVVNDDLQQTVRRVLQVIGLEEPASSVAPTRDSKERD